jgi:RNA polymerase sigma-70 factor (sigma-E family)
MDTVAALGFEEYVRTRQDALLRSARRLTPNPADAQDLLQIALTRTFPAWDGIVDKRHADAYIRRALINTRTTLWRSRKLDEFATDQLPETAVEDGAEQRADRAMLLGALGVLPQQQRDVVVLRYYEGMSTAETAQALGISTGTVKSTLHRALARLRTELERQDEHGRPPAKATVPVQILRTPRVPGRPRRDLVGAAA